METIKSVLRIIFGFLLLIAGVYLVMQWSQAVLVVVRAAIALFILLIGFAFIIIGFSDMKKD